MERVAAKAGLRTYLQTAVDLPRVLAVFRSQLPISSRFLDRAIGGSTRGAFTACVSLFLIHSLLLRGRGEG